jgi:hypothetical protein
VLWWRRGLSKIGDVTLILVVCTVQCERAAIEAGDPEDEPKSYVPNVVAANGAMETNGQHIAHQGVGDHNRPLGRPGVEQIVEAGTEQTITCPA